MTPLAARIAWPSASRATSANTRAASPCLTPPLSSPPLLPTVCTSISQVAGRAAIRRAASALCATSETSSSASPAAVAGPSLSPPPLLPPSPAAPSAAKREDGVGVDGRSRRSGASASTPPHAHSSRTRASRVRTGATSLRSLRRPLSWMLESVEGRRATSVASAASDAGIGAVRGPRQPGRADAGGQRPNARWF
jgi:hypothetical protein